MRYLLTIVCWLLCLVCNAQTDLNQLLHNVAAAKGDSARIMAYKALIVHYHGRSADSMAYYADKALQYAENNHYELGQANIIEQIGRFDELEGNNDRALERFLKAYALYKKLGNTRGIAGMENVLGAIFLGKGNYTEGIRYLTLAVASLEKEGNKYEEMMAMLNLGTGYMNLEDTAKAAKYLFQAAELSKGLPVTIGKLAVNNMVAVVYQIRGDLAKSKQMLKDNLALCESPEFKDSKLESMVSLADVYRSLGSNDSALFVLDQALKLAVAEKSDQRLPDILLMIAQIKREKDPTAALKYLEQSIGWYANGANRQFLIPVYQEMADVNKQLGNYKEALEATIKMQAVRDSFFNINKAKEIARITALYEVDKTTTKIKQLEAESMANKRERNIYLSVTVTFIIGLLVLSFFYRKIILLNRKLIDHEKVLTESNSMKDKLFSIIGHDLRGPIGRVPIILDLYEDSITDEAEKKYLLQNLKDHCLISLETLDKLLYWGQSLIKGIALQQMKFDAHVYTSVNVDLKKMNALEKNITIVDHTPPGLMVYADSTHFDFILRNLLSNAIKYTHQNGTIDIYADCTQQPGHVVFSVKDSGIGIRPEVLRAIFNPAHSETGTANEKGTGLGLMLCREFVLQNGGTIWAESTYGQGATFYFSVKSA